MKLTVVIPIHNEVETIRTVVERVQAVALDKEIILRDKLTITQSQLQGFEKRGFSGIVHARQNRGLFKRYFNIF